MSQGILDPERTVIRSGQREEPRSQLRASQVELVMKK